MTEEKKNQLIESAIKLSEMIAFPKEEGEEMTEKFLINEHDKWHRFSVEEQNCIDEYRKIRIATKKESVD
jgi:hypothetical protein